MAGSITVTINGAPETIPAGSTVADLIERFGEAHPSLITELDGRFVHPEEYARTLVAEGQRLEFIHPAFGG